MTSPNGHYAPTSDIWIDPERRISVNDKDVSIADWDDVSSKNHYDALEWWMDNEVDTPPRGWIDKS